MTTCERLNCGYWYQGEGDSFPLCHCPEDLHPAPCEDLEEYEQEDNICCETCDCFDQDTTDKVACCNCCEDYSFYYPRKR